MQRWGAYLLSLTKSNLDSKSKMMKFLLKGTEVGSTTSEVSGKDNPVVAISITTIENDMLWFLRDLSAVKHCDIETIWYTQSTFNLIQFWLGRYWKRHFVKMVCISWVFWKYCVSPFSGTYCLAVNPGITKIGLTPQFQQAVGFDEEKSVEMRLSTLGKEW